MLSSVEHEKSFITLRPGSKLFDTDGISERFRKSGLLKKNQKTKKEWKITQ